MVISTVSLIDSVIWTEPRCLGQNKQGNHNCCLTRATALNQKQGNFTNPLWESRRLHPIKGLGIRLSVLCDHWRACLQVIKSQSVRKRKLMIFPSTGEIFHRKLGNQTPVSRTLMKTANTSGKLANRLRKSTKWMGRNANRIVMSSKLLSVTDSTKQSFDCNQSRAITASVSWQPITRESSFFCIEIL